MHFIGSIIRFIKDEEGASGIEYALIAVMVAVVIATFVPDISDAIDTVFSDVEDGLVPAP
ncbi:MAG: Flp family type IVb pilin [Gammaproteobacteria bacterium]